jgi:hypothetical protein
MNLQWTSKLSLAMMTVLIAACQGVAQNSVHADAAPLSVPGSLAEIKGKRTARLVVIRPSTIDFNDPSRAAVEAVRSGQITGRRQWYAYAVIAKKLNKYIKKYGTMAGAEDVLKADYVIVFNLLRYRRMLYSYYPSGEMYVISYQDPGPARILWKTGKEMLAEEATSELIRAMKTALGQR